MADLGDLVGSLMVGLIRARRMADEQTAALAEYYTTNPLLEGLSVPRIRIPELTIDMPFLLEDYVEGGVGEMEEPAKIAAVALSQLKSTLTKNKITLTDKDKKDQSGRFNKAFTIEVEKQLRSIKQSGVPAMKEAVARSVQNAFADALTRTKITLTASEKELIARDLRTKVSTVSIAKEIVTSTLVANIKTSDVKEHSSDASVVRLKITLKEEGLEWAVRAGEAGGEVRTLQLE